MSTFPCRCGELLEYGARPSPNEWLLIPDDEFDSVARLIDADALYRRMRSLLRCPGCGRLWVFWKGLDHPPSEYLASSGK